MWRPYLQNVSLIDLENFFLVHYFPDDCRAYIPILLFDLITNSVQPKWNSSLITNFTHKSCLHSKIVQISSILINCIFVQLYKNIFNILINEVLQISNSWIFSCVRTVRARPYNKLPEHYQLLHFFSTSSRST